MNDISFSCPHCNNVLEAPGDLAGQTVECPKCGEGLVVPALEESHTSGDAEQICGHCGQPLSEEALICVSCGTNQKTGQRMMTVLGNETHEPAPQPISPPVLPVNEDESTTVECPHCKSVLSIPVELTRQVLSCPECNARLSAPAPGAEKTPARKSTKNTRDTDEGRRPFAEESAKMCSLTAALAIIIAAAAALMPGTSNKLVQALTSAIAGILSIGLFFSTLALWIVSVVGAAKYGLKGVRARFVTGTICSVVYVGLVILGAAMSLSSARHKAAGSAFQTVNTDSRNGQCSYPWCGVSLAVPAGWIHMYEKAPAEVSRFGKVKGNGSEPVALMMVEAQPAENRTLDESADGIGRVLKGTVKRTSVSLDGEKAILFSRSTPARTLHAANAVTCVRNGICYTISVFATENDPFDDLSSLMKTWKWIPIQEPLQCLTFRPDPVPFFDSLFWMKVPEIMRPYRTDNEETIMLGIFNLLTLKNEFFVSVDRVKTDSSMDLTIARDTFSAQIKKQMRFTRDLKWTSLNTTPVVMLADEVTATVEIAPGTKRTEILRYAIFRPSRDTSVVCTFTIHTKDPNDTSKYSQLVATMASSVQNKPGLASTSSDQRQSMYPPSSLLWRFDGRTMKAFRATETGLKEDSHAKFTIVDTAAGWENHISGMTEIPVEWRGDFNLVVSTDRALRTDPSGYNGAFTLLNKDGRRYAMFFERDLAGGKDSLTVSFRAERVMENGVVVGTAPGWRRTSHPAIVRAELCRKNGDLYFSFDGEVEKAKDASGADIDRMKLEMSQTDANRLFEPGVFEVRLSPP